MSDMQAKLGHALLKSLGELRQQKGDMSLEDVGAMFIQLASTLSPRESAIDRVVHDEIARMVAYIEGAKKEIFAISTTDQSEQAISDASLHLDEVIKSTEAATNTIMDAADQIQAAAGGVGGEKEQQIMDASMRIYEACNFQDVTGQRITKVIKLLTNLEERITKLNDLFGVEGAGIPAPKLVSVEDDASLLNGPQLAAQASSQEDIDALFASIGGKK